VGEKEPRPSKKHIKGYELERIKPKKSKALQNVKKKKKKQAKILEEDRVKLAKEGIVEAVRDQVYGRALANYENALVRYEIEKELVNISKEWKELTGEKVKAGDLNELLSFLREKERIPKGIGLGDLRELQANPQIRQLLKPLSDILNKYMDDKWKLITSVYPELSEKEIKNYLTHIWDFPRNADINKITNWFKTKSKFLQKRHIPTLIEGITKYGLKPKYLKATDIMGIYGSELSQTLFNAKMVKDLRQLEKDMGARFMLRQGEFEDGVIPAGWKKIDHPAINKPVGKNQKVPIYVPGELYKAFKVIFNVTPEPLEIDIKVPVIGNVELINAIKSIWNWSKYLSLQLSFFHPLALTEAGVAALRWRLLKGKRGSAEALMSSPLAGYFTVGMFKGRKYALEYPEQARHAIAMGVQVGVSHDFNLGRIQKAMRGMVVKTDSVPVAKFLTRWVEGLNTAWNNSLWDWLHDGLKIMTFERWTSQLPNDPAELMKDFGSSDRVKVERELANLVNQSYGGHHFQALMIDPRTVKFLGRILLSPDWQWSTLGQFFAPFRIPALPRIVGGKLTMVPRKKKGLFGMYPETAGKVRGKYGRSFWRAALIYSYVLFNSWNYINRKKDEEENPQFYPEGELDFWNRTMWGNPPGHKFHLFVGRYEDGSERYVRWGKQFKEAPEYFLNWRGFDPFHAAPEKVAGKVHPAFGAMFEAMFGQSISGFKNWEIEDTHGLLAVIPRLKVLSKAFLPYSTHDMLDSEKEWNLTNMFVPSSHGMTKYGAIKRFEVAISSLASDDKTIQGNDDYIIQVWMGAVHNNLDPEPLFDSALANVLARARSDYRDGLNTVKEYEGEIAKREANLYKVSIAKRPKELDIIKDLKKRMKEQKTLDNKLKQAIPVFVRTLPKILKARKKLGTLIEPKE
jgi:hypothetical protein